MSVCLSVCLSVSLSDCLYFYVLRCVAIVTMCVLKPFEVELQTLVQNILLERGNLL